MILFLFFTLEEPSSLDYLLQGFFRWFIFFLHEKDLKCGSCDKLKNERILNYIEQATSGYKSRYIYLHMRAQLHAINCNIFIISTQFFLLLILLQCKNDDRFYFASKIFSKFELDRYFPSSYRLYLWILFVISFKAIIFYILYNKIEYNLKKQAQ